MADQTDRGFAHLHVPASELRAGDVVMHGTADGNVHYVEEVGTETLAAGTQWEREDVTYTARNARGEVVEAHVRPDLKLDIRRNLNA